MIFPKQLYVRLDGLGGNKRHTLQIGRFEFLDGSEVLPKNATLAAVKRDRVFQRLIGNFGFSDVGRSFDGVHYAYATPNDNITFVGAVPTRGVFQMDGWGWNRIGLGYTSLHAPVGQRQARRRHAPVLHRIRRLPPHPEDRQPRAGGTARRPGQHSHRHFRRAHAARHSRPRSGTVDLLFWGAVQTGRWGVQQQRAGAFDVEGGFQPKILSKVRPWLRGGFTYGSGDGNPNDNPHGTFFQLLPTPRPYARFPFFNMMNTEDGFGILLLRPHPKVTVSSEFHALRLSDANDLWYSGGGAFQPWTFGYTGRATSGRRSLGNLYDTGVDYRVTRKLTLSGVRRAIPRGSRRWSRSTRTARTAGSGTWSSTSASEVGRHPRHRAGEMWIAGRAKACTGRLKPAWQAKPPAPPCLNPTPDVANLQGQAKACPTDYHTFMGQYLAFDLGAESGRAIAGELSDGQLAVDELHRFPNTPVRDADSLCWDTDGLWREIRRGLDVAVRERNLALDGIGVDTWGVDFGLLGADGQLRGEVPPLSRFAQQRNDGEGLRGACRARRSSGTPASSSCRSTRCTSCTP